MEEVNSTKLVLDELPEPNRRAALKASSAHVWVKCPSSLNFKTEPYSSSNPDRMIGNLTHFLISTSAEAVLGQPWFTEDDGFTFYLVGKNTEKEVEVKVDYDVINFVNFVRDWVDQKTSANPSWSVNYETKAVFHDQTMMGKADITFTRWNEELFDFETVCVADIKTGHSFVSPAYNEQLLTYASCFTDTSGGINGVELVVIMPRHEKVLEWEASPEDIKRHIQRVYAAKELAEHGGLLYLNTGPKQCGACANSYQCPAALAKLKSFTAYKEPANVEELAISLEWAEALEKISKKIKTRAKDLLESGNEVPGYQMQSLRSSYNMIGEDRKKACESLVDYLRENGVDITLDQVYTETLTVNTLSKSDIEKRITGKGSGELKKKVGDFFIKTPLPPSLTKSNENSSEITLRKPTKIWE